MAEGRLSPDDVSVYFCRRTPSATELEPLRLNMFGDIENWPSNFFGDEMADIAARTLAAMARKKAQGEVVLEEKLDGAKLGFSLSPAGELRAQNRGQYLQPPYGGQFVRLPAWFAAHAESIRTELLAHAATNLMLFGEWCAARHSLSYDRLPDWFLLFDVFERTADFFWSSARRDALALRLGLATVPRLAQGRYKLAQLKTLLADEPSRFRDGSLEGMVIRRESPTECVQRAKLVRADFTQGIADHWRSRMLHWNRVDFQSEEPGKSAAS